MRNIFLTTTTIGLLLISCSFKDYSIKKDKDSAIEQDENASQVNDAKIDNPDFAIEQSMDANEADSDVGIIDNQNSDSSTDQVQCSSEELLCNDSCVRNDEKNCGVCGHDCTALDRIGGPVECKDGECILTSSSCESGWADCNENSEDGCETDITEALDCGECDNDCSETNAPLCAPIEGDGDLGAEYQCTVNCPSNAPTLCSDSCVNTEDSPLHCGACDRECDSVIGGQPVCENGECGFECIDNNHVRCSDRCVANDSKNCGFCGNDCTKNQQVCDKDGHCVDCVDPIENCEEPENECMYAICDDNGGCSEVPESTGTECSIGTCNMGKCVCNTHEDCGTGRVCDLGMCQEARCGDGFRTGNEECDDGNTDDSDFCVDCKLPICGDGIVNGAEECDPAENLNGPFKCSALCRSVTKYTPCNDNTDCLNGTICGGLGICTRICSSNSDCDIVEGFPNLYIQCPVPLGNQCTIRCTSGSDQDCPPDTTCNGGASCEGYF